MTELAPDLRAAYEESGYVLPAYRDRCFADAPASALSLLSDSFPQNLPDEAFTGLLDGGIENVVLLVVDGFGLDQWARLREELRLLDAFETDGTVTPLTSTYPSETAAAITTLHTGLLPAEHGLLGWHQYLDSIGESIQTLPYLLEDGTPVQDEYPLANPRELFDGDTIYGDAEAAGVDTHVTQPEHIAGSISSELTTAGAETHAYWNVAEMAVTLRDIVADGDDPTHVTAYVPNVDTISHVTGTDTDRYDAQVRMITAAIRTGFLEDLDAETAAETALLVTADHGHTNVGEEVPVDLSVSEVQDCLARGADGEPIPPVGGPRNVQFHVADGRVADLRDYLDRVAGDDVLTFSEAEYRERGLFGSNHADPGETFDRRAPDLLAVHRESTMWHEADDKIGVHGGMTPEEMFVPFAAARASDLQD
ncbi:MULTISPECIES: alkaline phosphatase family protein [Halolamina]|uniref:Predicted pyrophosphatase or phosphodiesterase, AlkP superfamily n=1 Tax=Halolamina pelagica TaxID=699431 RepID=A0A1I5P7K4_9EURY|nr:MULTISPECIES: alkaline phosphatase family protein [Halolamina]NHX36651.1 alkaline phosphatase family protein [Halolamina sp. R1-12]SFP29511.1 Predicted pyrophosphatase or phosphodiesterase, AlkP superfamily [Halolamina pelagica]